MHVMVIIISIMRISLKKLNLSHINTERSIQDANKRVDQTANPI